MTIYVDGYNYGLFLTKAINDGYEEALKEALAHNECPIKNNWKTMLYNKGYMN